MEQLMDWQKSLIWSVKHPPRLVRWMIAAIFVAFALISLRETVYWLGFVATYWRLADAVVTGIVHIIISALLTIIALIVVRLAWPRGDTIASAATLLDDDASPEKRTHSSE